MEIISVAAIRRKIVYSTASCIREMQAYIIALLLAVISFYSQLWIVAPHLPLATMHLLLEHSPEQPTKGQ